VEQLRQMGEYQGITALTEVRVGNDPDRMILQMAQDRQIDLIILGTSISPATDRLYLGPRVERIVNSAPCPVVMINS
jgi:nucleotide-binding universal stress UspA family protein